MGTGYEGWDITSLRKEREWVREELATAENYEDRKKLAKGLNGVETAIAKVEAQIAKHEKESIMNEERIAETEAEDLELYWSEWNDAQTGECVTHISFDRNNHLDGAEGRGGDWGESRRLACLDLTDVLNEQAYNSSWE